MWLVGRSYAAAVERGQRTIAGPVTETARFYRIKVARPLRASGLDEHINRLHLIDRLTSDNVSTVLAAHARLVQVLANFVGSRPTSFASKYLHFHSPIAVPIYDSRATTALGRQALGRKRMPESFKAYDPVYAQFIHRYLACRDQIKERYGYDLTPRQMDRILW